MHLPAFVRSQPNSARGTLRGPPHRDETRTREGDIAYAQWLFEASSNVQMFLGKVYVLCQEDTLRAADELLCITHWIVTWQHQLGMTLGGLGNGRVELLFCGET
jgi:hypothetical protein